jgi:hypothetical protein
MRKVTIILWACLFGYSSLAGNKKPVKQEDVWFDKFRNDTLYFTGVAKIEIFNSFGDIIFSNACSNVYTGSWPKGAYYINIGKFDSQFVKKETGEIIYPKDRPKTHRRRN